MVVNNLKQLPKLNISEKALESLRIIAFEALKLRQHQKDMETFQNELTIRGLEE